MRCASKQRRGYLRRKIRKWKMLELNDDKKSKQIWKERITRWTDVNSRVKWNDDLLSLDAFRTCVAFFSTEDKKKKDK
ncbi:hypothetical protein V1477_010604 [Vespula maculifrons]|uniref:Uncharacterized protein n=1 Tax=Vespula maculifrons TaxID=7453 RepID=A0ABD2C2F7_VESMC